MAKREPNPILWGALALVLLAAILFGSFMPWKTDQGFRCRLCGASADHKRLFLTPLPQQTKESALTLYWRQNVEAKHKHEWVPMATGGWNVLGSGMVGDSVYVFHPRWILTDEYAVAVLRSLPSASDREAVMQGLWQLGVKDPNKAKNAIWTIRMAYDENPKRNDYPVILRNVGCYPIADFRKAAADKRR